MTIQKKPYLIIPILIEQPTWGGDYICGKKGWLNKKGLAGRKFGQSYELYSKSLLATTIRSSKDEQFSPEVEETIPVSHFTEAKPFPLIKFTQAKGNSFQLHVKPGTIDSFWRPKAESWYYFEDGKITFGVKKGINLETYKKTCVSIDNTMKKLSKMLINKSITLIQAQDEASLFIREKNPWQYVNVHEVQKGDIVDLSGGGLHHSWEEDAKKSSLGNVLLEVQQDEMDPVSTIRSFDQGKFLKDGTIREIQIDTYFKHLDISEQRNTLKTKQNDISLLDTPYYALNRIKPKRKMDMKTETSFHHLFVKEGSIVVGSENGDIFVSCGHSCFVPKGVAYTIEETLEESEVLQTYLN